LLAILTADFISRAASGTELRFYSITQYVVIILITMSLVFLQIIYRPEGKSILAMVAFGLVGLAILLFLRYRITGKMRVFIYTCLVSVLLNFYLNLVFYPRLLYYQSGSRVAEYVNEHHPGQPVRALGVLSFTLHFHADAEIRDRNLSELAEELDVSEMLVFTSENYLDSLDVMHVEYEILDTFDHFHTTRITGNFLNHKTRQETLHKYYLVSATRSSSPAKVH
jgi:hypothetical protein